MITFHGHNQAITIGIITIDGDSNIFYAGRESSPPTGTEGSIPLFISTENFSKVKFTSITGLIGNSTPNLGPNGSLSGGFDINSSNGISGLISSNSGRLSLTGVFIGDYIPSGTAPDRLIYDGTPQNSPLLNQTFAIRDGKNETTGEIIEFNIPIGATKLYLGIQDAYGYSGSPNAYHDNVGSFNAEYQLF